MHVQMYEIHQQSFLTKRVKYKRSASHFVQMMDKKLETLPYCISTEHLQKRNNFLTKICTEEL